MKKLVSLLLAAAVMLCALDAVGAFEDKTENIVANTTVNGEDIADELIYRDPYDYYDTDLVSNRIRAYSAEQGDGTHKGGMSEAALAMYEYIEPYFDTANIITGAVTTVIDGEQTTLELNEILIPCEVSSFGLDPTDKTAVSAAVRECLIVNQLDRPDLHWLSYELQSVRTEGSKATAVIFYTTIKSGRDTGYYENLTKSEAEANIALVNTWKEKIIEEAKNFSDTYTMQKYINETLCSTVTYGVDDLAESYSVVGAAKGKAVCEGYSKAFCMLLRELGMKCAIVTGTYKDQPHAWNGVLMEDGNWYQTDVTWNDSTGAYLRYFLRGEEYMLTSHVYDNYKANLNIDFSSADYVYIQPTESTTETSTEITTQTTTEITTETTSETTTQTTAVTTSESTTETTTETTSETTTQTSSETTSETTSETVSETVSTADFIFGGACANKTLSAADAAMILQKALNRSFKTTLENYTDNYIFYLDVDRSGGVDAADAAMVLQKVLNSAFIFNAERE